MATVNYDELLQRVERLEHLLGQDFPVPEFVRLTRRELEIFRLLMSRGLVSVDQFTMLGADNFENASKTLGVHIHKLRKKLLPYGIAIENVWSEGYRIQPAMKAKVRKLMRMDSL